MHVFVNEFTEREYLPAAHVVHATDPMLSLYLPATHPLQLLFVPDQPALQEQYVMLTLPDTEYEFAGHRMHSALSSTEYFPALQFTQVTAEVLEYVPAAQPEHA